MGSVRTTNSTEWLSYRGAREGRKLENLSRASQQCLCHLWQHSRDLSGEGGRSWAGAGAGAEGVISLQLQKHQQLCPHLAARVTVPEAISPAHEPRVSCCRGTLCCREHRQLPSCKWPEMGEVERKVRQNFPACTRAL